MAELFFSATPEELRQAQIEWDRLQAEIKQKIHQASSRNVWLWTQQRAVDRLQGDGITRPGHTCLVKIREAANVENILEAIEPSYRTKSPAKIIPKFVNRRQLREGIETAIRQHRVRVSLDNGATEDRKRKLAGRLGRHIRELNTILSEPEGLYAFERAARGAPSLEEMRRISALPGLIREVQPTIDRLLESEWHQDKGAMHTAPMNPVVSLVGVHLKDVFEKWIGRIASIGRPNDAYGVRSQEANSPYIRFVDAVLQEESIYSTKGTPFSRETISSYYKEAHRDVQRRA